MLKKRILIGLITVCFAVFPVSVPGQAIQDIEEDSICLYDLFLSSGCGWEYLNINGWGMLNRKYMSLNALEVVAEKAADFFEIQQGYDILSDEIKGTRQVNIRGINGNGQVITLMCHNHYNDFHTKSQPETYIVVNIIDKAQTSARDETAGALRRFFNEMSMEVQISKTLVGTFEGELDQRQRDSICTNLFRNAGAKVVEGMTQDGLVSKSGYSSLIAESVLSESSPINIQMAMRYNAYEGRTYLWVGTPIISLEY